jgi:hypothetical protein
VVAINDSVKDTLFNSNTSSSLSFRSDIGAEESGFITPGLPQTAARSSHAGLSFSIQFGICCVAVEKKQIPRPINLASE